MPEYITPLRDIRFVMNELLDFPTHYANLSCYEEATPELVDAILEEAAKFSSQVLAPINQAGDAGCTFNNGELTTPSGFKEAYKQYVDGGWPSIAQDEEHGGQGLPLSLSSVIYEINGTANWSWTLYSGLGHGAVATLEKHGSKEQQQMFLPKLTDGTWSGTMCLTEPHCGSDLALLNTKAEPNDDGTYNVSGTKIFITGGENDMVENIVHIVLARLPDAPAGVKGISLFIVPKFTLDANGNIDKRNTVSCGSIEHKMGLNGNATCVMNFDQAKGYLIGPANRGLHCMFTFMNTARLFISQQGVCHAELAFQGALAYAKDRLQMRSASGAKYPEKVADPIIVHADVRRMLLTQKSIAEGGRALIAYLAQLVDIGHASTDETEKAATETKLALLTPIAKAFLTELGLECTSHGVQVFGGHGFIKEWGMEQLMRDTKISCLYEGTTGIQALDLLARKILGSKGEILKPFGAEVTAFCVENAGNEAMQEFIQPIMTFGGDWQKMTETLGLKAMKNPDEIGAASVDYLMYSGYLTLAYFWAKMVKVSQDKLAASDDDKAFYQAKIKTARFYFQRILPRASGHAACVANGADSMMELDSEDFAF